MNAPTNRSPLKDIPLRVAGQSLDEEIRKVLDDDVTDAAAIGAIGVGFAIYEWVHALLNTPPQPWVMTFLAAFAVGWATWRVARARRTLRQLRQGRDGERAVAELLERLRESGFRVFHDVLGNGFNVDHVLVGPRGIYAVETKTITKPKRDDAKISYDGETVTLAGIKPERDPIKQVTALAKWIQELVKESTGRDVRVRPVVLYPGWFVDTGANKNKYAWVLNPKALAGFIEHEPIVLTGEDVSLIAYHLSRYCRSIKQ